MRALQLEPTSVVALRKGGGYDLGVRFEGFERGVREQVARLGAPYVADEGGFWPRHDAVRAGGPMRVKVAALPTQLPAIVAPEAFVWYATLGVGFAAGETVDLAAMRALGHAVVETGPSDDPWGPPPQAFKVMEELKRRFDPERRLNPGRFVGGL